MVVTQSDIDNLNAAIASGARSVTLGGPYSKAQVAEASNEQMGAPAK